MEEKSMSVEARNYDNTMHRLGRISMIVIIIVMISIPFAISAIFHEKINLSVSFWAAFVPVILVNLPGCLVEVVTYTPLLGTGGTYIAFISGNLSNLKIPCAMNARQMTGVEIGTKESEIVSTLSVASSAIVTTVTIILGVVLIIPLTPILENPTLLPAFKTVVPAVFGALGFKYAKEYPKVAILPMALSISLFLLFPQLTSSVSMLVFAIAIVSVSFAFLLYKKGKI
ncbi:MAG: hypothetical protein RSA97_05570 [Oscillospiraceae bacterium]